MKHIKTFEEIYGQVARILLMTPDYDDDLYFEMIGAVESYYMNNSPDDISAIMSVINGNGLNTPDFYVRQVLDEHRGEF